MIDIYEAERFIKMSDVISKDLAERTNHQQHMLDLYNQCVLEFRLHVTPTTDGRHTFMCNRIKTVEELKEVFINKLDESAIYLRAVVDVIRKESHETSETRND